MEGRVRGSLLSSGVVEASAGTGKTYEIESIVADVIAAGDARCDEILVVTFTDKAATELRARIRRALVDRRHGCAGELGAGARARLAQAIHALDGATICTLHAFCQRVLVEHAFAGGRLLEQTAADGRVLFDRAFDEALRRELSVDPRTRHWLSAYFDLRGSAESLRALLGEAHRFPGRLHPRFDEPALRAACDRVRQLAASGVSYDRVSWPGGASLSNRVAEVADAIDRYATPEASRDDVPGLLDALDACDRNRRPLIDRLRDALASPTRRGASVPIELIRAYIELLSRRVSFEAAVVNELLGPVRERLAREKRERGWFDFQDLLDAVDDHLQGPSGNDLAALLRARYPLALIDEFQDTDPVQWRIFRRIYLADSNENRVDPTTVGAGHSAALRIVGDPKQAIYGFRGADVHTYLRARGEMLEVGATRKHLVVNHRSSAAFVEVLNAVFDQGANPPFFSGDVRYEAPVQARPNASRLIDASGRDVPPVVLMVPSCADGETLRVGPLRRALTSAIVRELLVLQEGTLRYGPLGDERLVSLRDVFVLTRTTDESLEVGRALAAAGIAHTFYKQEGLLQSDEAHAFLALLRALETPSDVGRRLAAWRSPFFAVPLEALDAAAEWPATHPSWQALEAWRTVALERKWALFFRRVIDESGVVRHERSPGGSARRATNFLHVAEVLLGEAIRDQLGLAELRARLERLAADRRAPESDFDNVQRIDGDRDAVQIMTIHRSKGLEATIVFLFGGFGRAPTRSVRSMCVAGERLACVGPRTEEETDEAMLRETTEEEERLLYVALTRARGRVVAPFVRAGAKLGGPYRILNAQWERLCQAGRHDGALLQRAVPVGPASAEEEARAAQVVEQPIAVAGAAALDEAGESRTIQASFASEVRAARWGVRLTSYSRLRAEQERTDEADEGADEIAFRAEPSDADSLPLPAGRQFGVFLHEVLEALSVEPIAAADRFDSFAREPVFEALLREKLRRGALPAKYFGPIARLLWDALRTPVALGDAAPTPLARAARLAREMEILYAIAPEMGTLRTANERFVRGFIDVVFEHEGRTYFADWKTDVLDSYAPDALAAHVGASYALQGLLYSLGLAKMLHATDARAYERSFGGYAYCFVRGMNADRVPSEGTYFHRPSWEELREVERALARGQLAPGDAAGKRGPP